MIDHQFAIATCEEVWALAGRSHVLLESRFGHGVAVARGGEILASDARDEELVAAVLALRAGLSARWEGFEGRVRAIASVRRVNDVRIDEAHIIATVGGISYVCSLMVNGFAAHSLAAHPLAAHPLAAHPLAAHPCHPERSEGPPATRAIRAVNRGSLASLGMTQELGMTHSHGERAMTPMRWLHGSAAVLLHEAIGHASEHHAPRIAWPAWLTVHDEPATSHDDVGQPTRIANLLEEPPASFRRESFRDVPLRRMTNVVVRQANAPYELPERRIDVAHLAGGAYDPLTDVVTLHVVIADLVDGDETTPLAPFTITTTRARIAASLLGAQGEPVAYPGVVCSSEGQELVVGSHAPDVVTAPLA